MPKSNSPRIPKTQIVSFSFILIPRMTHTTPTKLEDPSHTSSSTAGCRAPPCSA